MLSKIISFSIQHKLLVAIFLLALLAFGSYQFTQLPIDAVPDITDNQVQIITTAPSLGAPDIERLITLPIEQASSNISGLKEIRSFSRFGLSLITIVFHDEVDVYWARQQVAERLKIAEQQIPDGLATPELAPVTTGLGEIYQYVLRSKPGYEATYDVTALRTIQDWIVRRQLLGVEGVADVSSFGGKLKQYEIAVDDHTLTSYHITINDVFSALEKNNENTGGAYIEKKSTVLYIRSEGLIRNIDDIGNIVVKQLANGSPLLIKDVARVRIGTAIRYGGMTYNDEGETAGAVVMMLKGRNSNEVIKKVKERILQIGKTLPEGVVIEPFLDRTKMVNSAIGTVTKNLLEGALIVIFVLVLFLGNIRAGFIVASVIPLAMLFAVIMMNFFGVSGNLMSLGALDFGLIVDGAVIIVEAVLHGLVHHRQTTPMSQSEMDKEVQHSSSRMMNSAVFGQMIILIVYLPIFTLQGVEGKMFKPMAETVAFALLGAFLLSLTYIPMMSALFLRKGVSSEKNMSDRMMEFLVRLHQKTLRRVIQFPKIVIGISVVLFLMALFIFNRMGGEFIPDLPEGDFAVETRVLTGSNIHTTMDVCLKASRILKSRFPEVEKVIGKVGSGEIPTDPMPMEAADLMVILKDKSQWVSAHSWDELAEKMRESLQGIPGVTFSFQYPVAMRFNELMTGAKQDVVCKIYGENLDTLSHYSKRLGAIVEKIKGTESIYVEPIDGLPQIVIQYNRNMMAQYGLHIRDVNRIVNTALAGQVGGVVFEDERRFDLVVRLEGDYRQNLDDVEDLLIPTPQGIQIPLHQVARVVVEESINQIQRDDARRRIIVGFNVKDRDVQSIVSDLQQAVDEQLSLPSGYYVKYGGAFENLEAAKKRLAIAVPISLFLIFLLLYFAFGSIKQGLLIYSAIPLSAIGGILFLALRGMPFSISAGVGFIALFGVAVLNGIVLIAEFNRIKKEGETNLQQVVLQGTRLRLRPVLMTAFVASLGFLPMAISTGNGAEVQRPLATVVIGGLLLATLLTLFVLPVLYVLFEKTENKKTTIPAALSFLLFLLSSPTGIFAQQPITYSAAVDSALKNNLLIKNEKLEAVYQQKQKAAVVEIPFTEITAQYGQFNSLYADNGISIAQAIRFPAVYIRQKYLQQEIYKSSLLSVSLKESELRKQVGETFYLLIYLNEKKKILEHSDSVFSSFLDKAILRFEKGESNVLEKVTAEAQRGQIQMQLNHLVNDMDLLQLRFQLLLHTDNFYRPQSDGRLSLDFPPDSATLLHHPQLNMLRQQQEIARASVKMEKSQLLPDLRMSYSNISIQGTGADNVNYDVSKRFSSVQFGIGLPLFFGSQWAKIKSEKIREQISAQSYELGYRTMKTEWDMAVKKYHTQRAVVSYYEETALENANSLTNTANQQFSRGDINYLEWTILIQQATAVRSQYADAVNELNQSIIQLLYLTSK